jgi:hypothetical protein
MRGNVRSAALDVALSTPRWYMTKRTSFLWHFGRFRDRPVNRASLELAQLIALEREEGRRSAKQFQDWLNGCICDELRDEVVERFRKALRMSEPVFQFFGSDVVQWRGGNLLDNGCPPQRCLQEVTGFSVDDLPENNPVRTFIEDYGRRVERESLIKPAWEE